MFHRRLKVVTLNVFATPFNTGEHRYTKQVTLLKHKLHQPDVICLQEAYAQDVKSIYEEYFKDSYHCFSTGSIASWKPSFVASALNFKLCLILLYLLSYCGIAVLQLEALSMLLFSLTISSVSNLHLKIPSLIYMILAIKMPRLRDILEGDTLGLMILVNKQTLKVFPESVKAHVFENQAFEYNLVGLFEWCFKPRGYLGVQIQFQPNCSNTSLESAGTSNNSEPISRILIVNTHLNVGCNNKKRLPQMQELANEMHRLSSAAYNKDIAMNLPVILCGDTNADDKKPEIKYLRNEGFCDTYLHYYNNDLRTAPKQGATWDSSNPLTHGFLIEPNQRVDYVFCKQSESCKLAVEHSTMVFDEEPFVSDHYGVMTQFLAITC